MLNIDSNTLKQLIELLAPLMSTEKERRALLTRALPNCPVLGQIDYEGNAISFTALLIIKLINFGESESGTNVLILLLNECLELVGLRKKQIIESIINSLTIQNALQSTRPGVSASITPSVFVERCTEHCLEKTCIGSYIAHYLRKHAYDCPIAVDGGSTNLQVLQAIHQDRIEGRRTVTSILTNHIDGIDLAMQLPNDPHTRWHFTGGIIRSSHSVFLGEADAIIRERVFTMAVVGANGFEPPLLQTTTVTEHPIKKAIVENTTRCVIFPIDSSKWGRSAGAPLYRLDDILSQGYRKNRVVLVTCYPIQEDQSSIEFMDRLNDFLGAVIELIVYWKQAISGNIELFTAPVDLDKSEFRESKVEIASIQSDDFQRIYKQTITKGQENEIGFIMRFDLEPPRR